MKKIGNGSKLGAFVRNNWKPAVTGAGITLLGFGVKTLLSKQGDGYASYGDQSLDMDIPEMPDVPDISGDLI